MYVCICNAVTDRDIRAAAQAGVRSFADVRASTGCSLPVAAKRGRRA